MMRRQTFTDSNSAPPPAAAAIVGWMTPTSVRGALLGDLAEEFGRKAMTSSGGARLWYWKQVIRSTLPLVLFQLRILGLQTLGLAIGMSLAGWVLIGYWDVYVSRQSASLIASQSTAPNILIVRTVYFVVQSVGLMSTGGIIAALTFRDGWRFIPNSIVFLGPISLALLVSGGMTAVSTHLYLYAGFRVAVALFSLVLGAFFVVRWRKSRTKAGDGRDGQAELPGKERQGQP